MPLTPKDTVPHRPYLRHTSPQLADLRARLTPTLDPAILTADRPEGKDEPPRLPHGARPPARRKRGRLARLRSLKSGGAR